MPKPTAKNQLKRAEAFELASWIKTNIEELQGHSREDVAARATIALGFTVTDGNILGALTATRCRLKFKRAGVPGAPKTDNTSYLAKCLLEVLVSFDLGEPNPGRLNAIARKARWENP
jgi:hypothetical protein